MPASAQPNPGEEVGPSPTGDPPTGYLIYENAGRVAMEDDWPGDDGYVFEVFRPSLLRMKPRGLRLWPFLGFYLLHTLRFFRTKDYAIYLARYRRQCVHYSAVIPKYFRFPFVAHGDLIISPTWTHPDHQGRGLSRACLTRILKEYEGQHCWYVVRKLDPTSQLVASRAGMRLFGEVTRTKRLGMKILGSFVPLNFDGVPPLPHPMPGRAVGLDVRAVSVLVGPTALGQVLVLLATPLLTRIYSPEDFAYLAIYGSIISVFAISASLRYEFAITLPKDDATALNVLALCLLLIFGMTAVAALSVWVLGGWILSAVGASNLGTYLWILPFGLLCSGTYQALSAWALRMHRYSAIGRTKLAQGVVQTAVQIGIGISWAGPLGLLVGDVLGRSSGCMALANRVRREDTGLLRGLGFTAIASAASRYWRFPALSLGAAIMNNIGLKLPLLLFPAYYGLEEAGYFALALGLFSSAGLGLVGQSVTQVFFAQASRVVDRAKELSALFWNMTWSLTLVVAPLLLVLAISAGWIVPAILGPRWAVLGLFVQLLSPYFAIQFIISPVLNTLDILERQDLLLAREVIRLIIPSGVLLLCGSAHAGAVLAVGIYSVAGCIVYILSFLMSWYAIATSRGPALAVEGCSAPLKSDHRNGDLL